MSFAEIPTGIKNIDTLSFYFMIILIHNWCKKWAYPIKGAKAGTGGLQLRGCPLLHPASPHHHPIINTQEAGLNVTTLLHLKRTDRFSAATDTGSKMNGGLKKKNYKNMATSFVRASIFSVCSEVFILSSCPRLRFWGRDSSGCGRYLRCCTPQPGAPVHTNTQPVLLHCITKWR